MSAISINPLYTGSPCIGTLANGEDLDEMQHDAAFYTTFTSFSVKYHLMCKVYTDVGGIKKLCHVCPPVRKIIHSLKLVDYLHVQADNPWYNYYLSGSALFAKIKATFKDRNTS